jgi:2-(1,2-epoxy-1,2-dihydrophenyl)acetyl-CoA isomerase
MDMASMADIHVMSDKARVGMNYVRMGLLPGDAGCYFLPRIIGISKALELIWTGKMIDADEALRIGYVNAVFPDSDFLAKAKEYSRQFMNAAVPQAPRLVCAASVVRNINLEMAEMAMLINGTGPHG